MTVTTVLALATLDDATQIITIPICVASIKVAKVSKVAIFESRNCQLIIIFHNAGVALSVRDKVEIL
jgi:hypothetical protein